MPNIGNVLRDEITRLSKRTSKGELESLRRASAQHRREIVALKRQVAKLAKQLTGVVRARPSVVQESSEDAESTRFRFSAKGFAKKRQQLELSAADMARLIGVSGLSVYKWESGKTRPRQRQLEAIASVRTLGKRAAAARLELDA